jgi:hypothetical protein
MLRNLLITVFTILWASVLVLVGGRFLALLTGANGASEIIERLYRHSDFWVKPFFNMFELTNKAVEDTGGTFEPASLLAFVVYTLAGVFILALVNGSLRPRSRNA